MTHLQLVHWHDAEAAERAARLRAAGYDATTELPPIPELLRRLRDDPPAAVVIDLTRLPSQGRDLAVNLRHRVATRGIPLVLVGGAPDKVAALRALLPDATYTTWEAIGAALAEALAHPPATPIAPDSLFAGYAGKPLATKLGIKPGTILALCDPPEGFATTLGALPAAARWAQGDEEGTLRLWFVRSRAALAQGLDAQAARLGRAQLWILWPKRGASLPSDLTQQAVREAGLAAGLVDFKICAVDATWSGLLFRWRGKE